MTETFYRIWSPTRGYWYMTDAPWSGPAYDAWTPNVLDARSDPDRVRMRQARDLLRTRHHGQNDELPPCPDARLVRVTVRRVSRGAQPDESDSETLKTLVAGLRAFAGRELVAPQEPPPGAAVYTYKLKAES